MKTAIYIAKNALDRLIFVFSVQIVMILLELWISNTLSGPYSPDPETRFRMILLINSFSVAVGFLAAFAINIYPAFKIAQKFNLSFEDSALLVSKVQILYDKQMDQLTAEYVYAELDKEKTAIELI